MNRYKLNRHIMKLTLSLIILLFLIVPASAWLSGYDYRIPIEINNTGDVLINYQYNFTVNTSSLISAGKMNVNGNDCRITNTTDVLQEFWNETAFNISNTKLWVNGTSLDNTSNTTHYMYYGNPAASSVVDGDATFNFFDSFRGDVWVKDENNPVLENSTESWALDNLQLYTGPVIEFNETYWGMYYGANQAVVTKDQIFLATSLKTDDGHNWTKHTNTSGNVTPVLTFGTSGQWDDSNVYGYSVIKDGATWKLWYVGDDGSGSPHYLRVGYATSIDGITWTKNASNPVLTDDIVTDGIGTVGVIKDGATYYMAISHYYTDGVDVFNSSDGVSWSVMDRDAVTDIQITDFFKHDGVFYIYGYKASDRTYVKAYKSNNPSTGYTSVGVQLEASMSDWETRTYLPKMLQINTTNWMLFYTGWTTDPAPANIGIATLESSVPYVNNTLDTTKWEGTTSIASVTAGILTVTPDAGNGIHTISKWDRDVAFRSKVKRLEGEDGNMIGFVDGWGTDGLFFRIGSSGATQIQCFSGGSYTSETSTTSLTSYKTVDVTWLTDNAGFIVNDVTEANSSITTHVPTGNIPIGFHGTISRSIYSDWVLVRNFVSTEPTTSLSTEESEPILKHQPPTPTSLTNTTGNFWVNYTWSAGSGNVTDSYNVLYNSTWDNTSSNTYRNESVGAHGYLDIVVYAYNNSGSGTLSTGSLTDNVTVPNNVISISDVSASYTINEGETLSIDANYTDTDSDTGTFNDNSSVWNVEANTGIVSWVTSDGDDGIYNWYINVSDSYGSTSTQEFTVTVNNSIYPPSITLVSFSPTPLLTNYTGATTISYMVNSSEPLNLSSLAFLYGVNYTITGDMHNYIAVPPNDIAFEGIYRAPNRNTTPYLTWETNTTITNNSVWQWGGGDNNSWWISKTSINATHTWVNVTGITQHILPSSFYIKKTAMYTAPKTAFEVSRSQGLIFKMWNVEEIRNRDSNYLANLYFDTMWESTTPTDPIKIGFCNDSYDPTVDDIDTCSYCIKFAEWNGTQWINHSWDPGANASYASPLVVNGSQYTDPNLDDINYIWLRSETPSSKSYVLNATNHDPGITNISYNETNVMWTYNEINGETDPVAYTPSFFTTFVRNDEELLHHLYIANDQGEWGHSDIFNETIGISSVPVPPISFEHFCLTLDTICVSDTDMDSTYDNGTLTFNIHAPADPDGGSVDHNITLHYANNQTLAGIINNTLTTTGDEYVDISFDTTPYYSSNDYYTMRCVSVDNEGSTATQWLISNFTLDADGNQGWISNGAVNFWGFNDIPTLYTTINNDSLISYDVGDDIYTMHIPFFKSKYNDTFNFNETVYLKSLNNEDVAYFRFIGETVFDNANIYAWNTTSDTPAPITDTYRGYVYSTIITSGNIDNSEFSYLGSDLYRQEGLNFVGTTNAYTINNTIFSHNAEGLIMENCANFTISNSTISDNVNVGVGVYFSNDTILSNNTITSNGGRGVSVYGGHDNIIRYNDITDSGIHGIHMWSNSINNTCTGNDITGSTTYDYYLSSSSVDNYIIDPASTTDKIRVTSTSNVNIENTDNTAFSEDSLNTSYAYLTNFSMYVSGVSQTFDITQHTATITPSTDKLSIWNLEWDDTLTFNASSDTALNPTWYNVTNTSWSSGIISIYTNGTFLVNETADSNGLITYNYSDTYSEKWFEFQLVGITPTPTPTPTPTETVTPPPSGGSSSGTGTTGVGTSDEPLYNIDCRETGKIRNLQDGTETYYRTTKPDCTDIIKVTFTPTQNSPEQPILIEKLHNISRFVTTPAPGITYSNFNLYVGLFGYDSKTTNEKILFKVSKDWASSNNVTPESVTLYIFEPSTTSWKSLPTTLSHTDTLYYVYESESGATYGRFAIVGTDKVSLNIIDIITEKIENIIPSINISESKFVTGATSLYNNIKEYIINLLPTSISFDTISNIFDNENASTYIMAILTIILIAAISYFYNYEHGLIAGILAIILMIIVTILQDTALIKFMSVEAGNIIISTISYTTFAFIISYILGEKLK